MQRAGVKRRANSAMQRKVQTIIGYAIVVLLFAFLLALELCFIAGAVVGVLGIVALMRSSIAPGEVAMNSWRLVMTAIFGLVVLASTVGAALVPYIGVTGWKSGLRQ
jgi:hypothetical protein